MDYSRPGFSVLHHLPEFAQIMYTNSVLPSNHLILLRHPLGQASRSPETLYKPHSPGSQILRLRGWAAGYPCRWPRARRQRKAARQVDGDHLASASPLWATGPSSQSVQLRVGRDSCRRLSGTARADRKDHRHS